MKLKKNVTLVVQLGLVLLVGYLSINPVMNLLSSHQVMNKSYDSFDIVNTYGAFGTIGKKRPEIIIEGTYDDDPKNAHWVEYEFKCKPGNVSNRQCLVTPYHYRLDWQIWFAAMQRFEQNPWLRQLIFKLLQNDKNVLELLGPNPFPNKPPKWIRGILYEYKFTHFASHSTDWWERKRLRTYFNPLRLENLGN